MSSSHAKVEHVPLFSHFWSREHEESSPSKYTFDSDATITPSELKLRHDFEQFVLLFELRKDIYRKDPSKLVDKALFVETRMVIWGRDSAHRKEIFGEQCRRSFYVYFACHITFVV